VGCASLTLAFVVKLTFYLKKNVQKIDTHKKMVGKRREIRQEVVRERSRASEPGQLSGANDYNTFFLRRWCCVKISWSVGHQYFFRQVGNCDNFYFTFKFEVRMRVQILLERDQISICHLINNLNPKTDKPKDYRIRPNIEIYTNTSDKNK
jgi:hypothetical protein